MTPFYHRFFIKIILFFGFALTAAAQQPFECDGAFYFVATGSNNNGQLIRIVKDTTSNDNAVITTLSDDLGSQVTAIGFNVLDNFIYGLERGTWALLRMGADGFVENLGVPVNLDPNLDYFAGEVRPQGGGLFVIGREPGGNDKSLYTINLSPPYYAGLASIVTDEPVHIMDMAFDPVFGSLFGFDEIKKRLVKISVGGLVTSVHYESQPQIGSLGAIFFDRWGHLYGLDGGANQHERLLRFNKFNGTVEQVFEGPGGGNRADGCSCPYRIDLFKRYEPAAVVPCSEVMVTYVFRNTAATAYGQKSFVDMFPPAFTITEIVRKPYSTVVSGVGTNELHLKGMEVLLDKDSIVLKINTGDFSGLHKGQALAAGFPLGLGLEVPSDDPSTLPLDDSTSLLVADSGQVILQQLPKICPGGQVLLAAAGGGSGYLWNQGATTPEILVSQPGLYWVEVQGICGTYRDTVLVEEAPPPWIDLGADRNVPFGQPVTLTYHTNASGNLNYQWVITGAMPDCLTCPNPQFTMLTPAQVSVTVTDANGCVALDDLLLGLEENRRVFFPNAFSPNGDGINDTFFPQAKGVFLVKSFRVFDRWGGILFEKTDGIVNDPALGWDGTARGRDLGAGTYLWMAEIEFDGGEREWFAGSILLVR